LIPLASVAVAPGTSIVMKVNARAAVGVPTSMRTAPTTTAVESSDVEFLSGRFVVFIRAAFTKNPDGSSIQFRASADCRFEFQKGSQLFVGVHHKTLSVACAAAMISQYFAHHSAFFALHTATTK
jgi:hypothetical protein